MRACARLVAGAALSALLAACASHDNLVVVLPESDGHVGAVVVHSDTQSMLLDKPYAAAQWGGDASAMKPVAMDAQQVNRTFGAALAAQPIPPKSYTLYFTPDSDRLVLESQAQFDAVFTEIARRQAAEIVVTGHTDSMGALDYNDKLSLERARAVARLFVARGLPADSVIAVGRGKRELLVATPDQTPEPRNRRVEITVR